MLVVLFARCSNCQTVFQVTTAQLEAARGFVRCGRCQTAFNALDSLQDEHGRPVSRPNEENDASAAGFIHIASDQPTIDESPKPADERPQPTVVKVIGNLSYLDTIGAFTAPSDASRKTRPKATATTSDNENISATPEPNAAPAETDTIIDVTAPAAAPEIEIPTLFLAATMEDLSKLRYPAIDKPSHTPLQLGRFIGWLVACCIMLIIFFAQLIFVTRNRSINYLPLRSGLELTCQTLGCELPPRRSLTELIIQDRNVAIHPKNPDALIAEMIFINQASFAQPLPLIEFSLLDPSSEPIAWRQFSPKEYLSETLPNSLWIEPNQSVLMKIAIVNPGGEMENYRFRFY